MESLLSEKKYPDQYRIIKDLMSKLGTDCPIYFYKNHKYMAAAYTTVHKRIVFSSAIIEEYKQRPYILRFFAAHELIHYMHNDKISKREFICSKFKYFIGIKRRLQYIHAQILLQEMRANIEGSVLCNLTPTEIDRSQDEIQERNDDPVRPISYRKYGYPDREMIKEYAKRYTVFNQDVAAEILNDYSNSLMIRDANLFSKVVISSFFDNT